MNAYRKKMSKLRQSVAILLVLLLVGPQNVAALPTPGTMTPVTVGYGYDGNGNLTSRTDGNGNVTTFEYDTMDRLLSIDYPGGNSPDISFTYDQNGNPTSMTDATGMTTYVYNFYDRLIGIDYPDGNFVQYGYDNVGNITDLQYGNRPMLNLSGVCTRIRYEFDENNRINSVRNVSTNDTTTYTYDAAGNLSRRILPNGAYTDYRYDNDGRLIDVEHRKQDSSLICNYEYSLNSIGNRTQVVETTPTGTKTTAYRYDPLDRLDTVVYPDGRFVDYGYDSFGNRTRMTEAFGGTTKVKEYTYDTDNRLLSTTLDGAPEEYFYYDTTGNLIQRVRVTNDRQIDYAYDYENRLVHYFDGTNNVEYVYNGAGERVAKIVNGVRTNFINDPNRVYVQVLAETDDSGVARRVYEWGNELINQEDINGASRHYYLHDSINGSVRRVIDADQNVINSYEYAAFGEVTTGVEGIANDYRFHGEVEEEETGLVFLRARYYDPETARFLTRDLVPGKLQNAATLNPYPFALNDPVNLIDPSGRSVKDFLNDIDNSTLDVSLKLNLGILGKTFFQLPEIKGLKNDARIGVEFNRHGVKRVIRVGQMFKGKVIDFGWGSDPSSMNTLLEKRLRLRISAFVPHVLGKVSLSLGAERFRIAWSPGMDTPIQFGASMPNTILISNPGSFFAIPGDLALKLVKAIKPGGIALNRSADVLLDINEITGGTYDPNTGQIILYGKEDSSSTALPPMNIDDLAVAFRAVNLGTMPVVSIEAPIVSSSPEWPGRDCFTVRYSPFYTNPDTGEPEVLDVSSKTHFGWVMYEADRHMKCLGLGKDNRDGTPVTSNVPGYYNLMDLIFMLNLSEGESMNRFWFHPGEIVVAPSADGRSMELKKAEMQLSTETMFSSGGQVESMPDAEYFANHFTQHYDEFAAEQITYDDEGNLHYIFKEMKQLAALVGIVKWVKEYNIPMDLSFLEDYTPQYYKSAPSHTPVTSVTETSSVDGGLKMATLWGGVDYCSELLGADGDPSQLAAAALDSRTEETELAWTFNKDGKDYNVAALSVDRKEKYGGFSHSNIDAALRVNGASPMVLARHFDSFNVTSTMFGWGWKAQPYVLEFKGDREVFNLCTRQWEGFGEVLFNDRGSQAVYKFVPSGLYDKDADPLRLASRFDPNEEILVYRYKTKDVPGLLFSDNKTRMTMRLATGILLDFDLDGRLTRTEDRNGNIIDYAYDASKRLISIGGQSGGRTITFTYNDQNSVRTASLPDGHSILYTYDGDGNLKSAHADAPTGRLLQYRYDADHSLLEIQDENGNAVASLSYDLYGRVTSTTQPDVATPFTHDHSLADKTSQITGPESFSQSMEFNDNHDLIKITDSRGSSSKMAYNSSRDMIFVTMPDGWTREHYFDYRGNQMATVLPNGRAVVTIFDLNNNPVDSFHSPANAGFYNSFDPEHVLTSAGMDVDPANHTQYAYDDKGNLTTVTDANGNEYTFGYDSVGNLIWTKDAHGHQATCVYDEHSRLIRVNNELGHAVGFAYDKEDNLIHVATTAGTVDFAYNDKNQLTRVTTGDPGTRRTMKYTYDAKGQIKTVTDPGGIVTEYTYDARGNLSQIRHDGIDRFTYEYDGLNQLTGTHYDGTAGGGRDATVDEYSNMINQPDDGTEEEASNTRSDESDSDSDGLPDGWEEANGLDPKDPFGDNGPYGDPDGDGYTNREEFFGDSNPNDHTAIPPVPPKITSFTPSDSNPFILEEDEIAFSATATDPDGNSISYSWRLDGLEQATTTSWTFVTTDESSGTNTLFREYLVELLITAGGDQVSRKWNTVVRNRNHAPVLQLIPDLSVRPGDTIQLEPVFSDPDNENSVPGDDNTLTVEYLGWMAGSSKTVTLEDYGVHCITVVVPDDGNPIRTDQQTVHITVEAPNLQPHHPTGWDNNIVVSDVEDTHADVAAIGVGQPCYIDYAEVNNNGSEYAGPSRMRLLVDGVEVDTVSRQTGLAPQAEYIREDLVHTFMTVGWHTVELIVDADGEVAEGNESDNLYTKNIYVAPFVKQFEETSYYLKDVCFIDPDIGWAVGEPHWDQTEKRYKRTIIKTVDGGEAWIAQEAGVGDGLRGVCFVDADNGLAVGANGTILHTSDGGITGSSRP